MIKTYDYYYIDDIGKSSPDFILASYEYDTVKNTVKMIKHISRYQLHKECKKWELNYKACRVFMLGVPTDWTWYTSFDEFVQMHVNNFRFTLTSKESV